MFKIGDFSQLSKVPVKTLRYYADIGLLPPARIDTFTSYRYYTVEQLPRLNRILALRDLGFTLEQMKRLLDDDLSVEQMRGMLLLRQAEIEKQIDAEQGKLVRVEQRLLQMELEDEMSTYDVVVKRVDSTQVVSLRDTIPAYSQLSQLFDEMFQYLGRNSIQPAGPPMTIYHDPEFKEESVDVELAVPIKVSLPGTDRIHRCDIPAVDEMATCIMKGSYDHFGQAYETLMRWIETNEYQLTGPPREVYLRGPESGQSPDEYITEIQIPVRKAEA